LLGASQGDSNTDRSSLRSVRFFALCVVEQRRAQREKGRGLSEGQRPEFRSPPLRPSSAENPAQPGDAAGTPFLWVLSFGKTKESTSPVSGETQHLNHQWRLRSQ
jgi:hypothetical protein